jgi:16S rRNA (uracil1498-N3)-methyltransferase
VNPGERALLRDADAHVVIDQLGRSGPPALGEDASHHLFRVLRLRDGDVVTVTDGHGCWQPTRVVADALEPDGEVRVETPPSNPVTVALAIPKRDRPEWIVQKLTELGVSRIVFVHAERSVVRWDGARAERHLAKLRRVGSEAVQQSRGVWLPEIDGPVAAVDVLPGAIVAEPGGRELASTDRVVAVGPEGGWTADELALAADRVDLGPRILRVETAALVLAARIGHHTE